MMEKLPVHGKPVQGTDNQIDGQKDDKNQEPEGMENIE
jgi:hypothetical protein